MRLAAIRAKRRVSALRRAPASGIASALAQDERAERVRHDEAAILGDKRLRKIGRHGKGETVAEGAVVGPFAVAAEIGKGRFDLDDEQDAVAAERQKIGAAADWRAGPRPAWRSRAAPAPARRRGRVPWQGRGHRSSQGPWRNEGVSVMNGGTRGLIAEAWRLSSPYWRSDEKWRAWALSSRSSRSISPMSISTSASTNGTTPSSTRSRTATRPNSSSSSAFSACSPPPPSRFRSMRSISTRCCRSAGAAG